jgi:hypothetical protein
MIGQRLRRADEFGPLFEKQLPSALPFHRRRRHFFLSRRRSAIAPEGGQGKDEQSR